jgi:hypothetical protein
MRADTGKGTQGDYPLHLAIRHNRQEVVHWLVAAGPGARMWGCTSQRIHYCITSVTASATAWRHRVQGCTTTRINHCTASTVHHRRLLHHITAASSTSHHRLKCHTTGLCRVLRQITAASSTSHHPVECIPRAHSLALYQQRGLLYWPALCTARLCVYSGCTGWNIRNAACNDSNRSEPLITAFPGCFQSGHCSYYSLPALHGPNCHPPRPQQ